MIEIDPASMDVRTLYQWMISAIVPRPIAFVSTVSPEGIPNVAPFSYFNGVSTSPPCVMISITYKSDGSKKDTLRNIEATGQFVINSANEWLAEPLNQCSAAYPYGVNEMEKVGLTPLPSIRIKPPRVQESALHLECELYKSVEVGEPGPGASTLILGRIVLAHIREDCYQDGKVLLGPYRPLSRLGGLGYGKTPEAFDLPRPRA